MSWTTPPKYTKLWSRTSSESLFSLPRLETRFPNVHTMLDLQLGSGSVKIIRFVNDHTFCQEEVGFEPCVIEKRKVGLQELSDFYLQHNLETLVVNTATNMLDFFDVNHFTRSDDFLLFASSPSPPHLDI